MFCCADIEHVLSTGTRYLCSNVFGLWNLPSHITYFIFVTSIADGKGRLVCDGSCDACKHRETSSAFLTTDIPECGGTNIIPREKKTDSEVIGGSEIRECCKEFQARQNGKGKTSQ